MGRGARATRSWWIVGYHAGYLAGERYLRSPALQKTTGTPLAAPHALTHRANRPAIRIRWVLSSSASLPPCHRRHQVRNPPGHTRAGRTR